MKHYYQIIAILSVRVFCIRALVFSTKLDKGANGCKTKAVEGKGGGVEIAVGKTVDDPLTCGVIVCQNKDGDALIHYCQIPAAFEQCGDTGVLTDTPWPECCWKCVNYVACKSDKARYRTIDAPDDNANDTIKTEPKLSERTIGIQNNTNSLEKE